MKKIFATFLSLVGYANHDTLAEKGEVTEEHLSAANTKITELQSNLEKYAETISTKEAEITRLQTELKNANEATLAEKTRADKAEGEKATVETSLTEYKTNLQRAVDALAGKKTYTPVSEDKNEADKPEEKSFATSVDQELADARKQSNWKSSKK